MKKLIILLALFSYQVFAVCDSPISRTNNSANTVLTSTKYNADVNTVYTHSNDLDGSCLVDSSVTSSKLDTSDLGPVVTAIKEGCKVTRSDAATLSVDRCRMAINGNMVTTTSATTETWGCSGCAAETASSDFYLYAKSDSTGSTLNLLLLSATPNNDGYDGSNNRVLARFYNDASGDISQYAIDSWSIDRFRSSDTSINDISITVGGFGTPTGLGFKARRNGDYLEVEGSLLMGTPDTERAKIVLPDGYFVDFNKITGTGGQNFLGIWSQVNNTNEFFSASANSGIIFSDKVNNKVLFLSYKAASDGNMSKEAGATIGAAGNGLMFNFKVPIAGWE